MAVPARNKTDRLADPLYGPGTRVRVVNPESPGSPRKGHVGVIARVSPAENQRQVNLHVVHFDGPVKGRDGRTFIVPGYYAGRCLEPINAKGKSQA